MDSEAENIRNKIRKGYPRTRTNVLLVGTPGVGKSSLTNSLIMAISPGSETCKQFAKSGKFDLAGGGGANTRWIKEYNVMEHLELQEDECCSEDQNNSDVCIWDIPGLMNADDYGMTQMLQRLFTGILQEGDDPREVAKQHAKITQDENEETGGCLYIPDEETIQHETHIILFVHDWQEHIPENLIDAVSRAQYAVRREIEVCLVVSKMDLAKDAEQKQKLEKSLAIVSSKLGISSPQLVISVESYQPHAKRNPEIDKNMFQVWSCIQNKNLVGRDLTAKELQLRISRVTKRQKLNENTKMLLKLEKEKQKALRAEKKLKEQEDQMRREEEERRLQEQKQREKDRQREEQRWEEQRQREIERQREEQRQRDELMQREIHRIEQENKRREEERQREEQRREEQRQHEERMQQEFRQLQLEQREREEEKRREEQRQREEQMQWEIKRLEQETIRREEERKREEQRREEQRREDQRREEERQRELLQQRQLYEEREQKREEQRSEEQRQQEIRRCQEEQRREEQRREEQKRTEELRDERRREEQRRDEERRAEQRAHEAETRRREDDARRREEERQRKEEEKRKSEESSCVLS